MESSSEHQRVPEPPLEVGQSSVAMEGLSTARQRTLSAHRIASRQRLWQHPAAMINRSI